jgi:prepilin-type N-terminal cleavage/methylation domain-containing protein
MVKSYRQQSRGYTFVELLIAVVVVSMVLTVGAGLLSQQSALNAAAYRVSQEQVGRTIVEAMKMWAENTGAGQLPTPYTGGAWLNAPVDPAAGNADAQALLADLDTTGLLIDEVMTDGRNFGAVRVYQLVEDITMDVPVFGVAGPTAEIRYDAGVLYMTACRQADAACYPNPVTNLPGASPERTAANLSTWDVAGTDLAPVRFTNIDIQERWLEETVDRVKEVREALRDYFQSTFLASPPDATVNHFPAPDAAGAPDLSGADPLANEGCRDGWYALDAANVNVLALIGRDAAEYGATPWGGSIEYCRDYDPGGAGGANTPPHNAAVRIHREVSRGIVPGAPGDNLVFTL